MTRDDDKGEWAEDRDAKASSPTRSVRTGSTRKSELTRAVTATTTGDDTPATSRRASTSSAGDDADAVTDGGAKPTGDLKDVGAS